MTNLGEGATRQYRLVVETPAGSDEVPITVLGRDELDVPSGTRTLSVSRRFSRMDIGLTGTAGHHECAPAAHDRRQRARLDPTRFAAGGSVVSRGAAVETAPRRRPGPAGTADRGAPEPVQPGLGRGGPGGTAGSNGGTAGAPGGAGGASVTQTGAGAGGVGGSGGGGGLHSHRRGDGTPGSGGRRTLAAFIPAIIEVGPGGGGGGEEAVARVGSGPTGGGGGGGGAGGGAFRISAGEEIRLAGDVFALGGDGGIRGVPLRHGRRPGVHPESSPVEEAEGAVVRAARSSSPGVRQRVGDAGRRRRAAEPSRASVRSASAASRRSRRSSRNRHRRDPHRRANVPSRFRPPPCQDPTSSYRRELVSTSPQLVVSGFGADQVRVLDRCGNVHTHFTAPVSTGPFDATSRCSTGSTTSGPTSRCGARPPAMTNAAIRSRTVIYLSNTVSSYSFSCSIAPAQVTVPTERTVTLSASVTASQPSPIEWGLRRHRD